MNVSVELYNFGESEFSGRLRLQLPAGYQGNLDGGKISIGPMGRVVRNFELSPGDGIGSEPGEIRVDLVNASGEVETFILAWVAVNVEEG